MSAPLARRSLSPALRRVAAGGFAHVDGLVGEAFLRDLRREVEGGPLRRMAGTFGAAGVRMEIDGYDLEAPFEGFPLLTELASSFTTRVRSDGGEIRGLRTWRPNEAGVAVYRSGSVGVTSHLDGRWYRRLVAVFTRRRFGAVRGAVVARGRPARTLGRACRLGHVDARTGSRRRPRRSSVPCGARSPARDAMLARAPHAGRSAGR